MLLFGTQCLRLIASYPEDSLLPAKPCTYFTIGSISTKMAPSTPTSELAVEFPNVHYLLLRDIFRGEDLHIHGLPTHRYCITLKYRFFFGPWHHCVENIGCFLLFYRHFRVPLIFVQLTSPLAAP